MPSYGGGESWTWVVTWREFIHLLVFMVSTIQIFNKMIIQSVGSISHPTWLLGVSDSPGECVFEYGFWCWIALMLKVYQQVLQEVLWKSHSRSVVMPQVLEHQCFTGRIFWILNSETWVGCHLVLSDKHLFSFTVSLDHLSIFVPGAWIYHGFSGSYQCCADIVCTERCTRPASEKLAYACMCIG